jgi:predicted peptidase
MHYQLTKFLLPLILLSQIFSQGNTKNMELGKLVSYPNNYEKETNKRWPLILFLHGIGERGENLNLVKLHGIPKIVESNNDFQFITLSPQCPLEFDWRDDKIQDKVISILEDFIENNNVDKERVYITGLSMGGYGTWAIISKRPEIFAAAIPICGGGDHTKVGKLKNLPIWAFHGADDQVIKVEETIKMVDAINAVNGKIKFTLYPDTDHDSWSKTYNNKSIYNWLLSHSRNIKK